MLFSSWQFIFIFLPTTFFVYFLLTKRKMIIGSKVWLVITSLFFYGYWNIDYIPLILGSLAINFALGTSLYQSHVDNNRINRKVSLIIGIIINISFLAYFKYAGFMVENINAVTNLNLSIENIVLPLAISFFTFQQIAYLVDSYKGQTSEYDLLNYMLFVTFFPQLIAGPIVHHNEMMSQFYSKWNWLPKKKNVLSGVLLFSIGLFKKVVIADTFSIWANAGFANSSSLDIFGGWVTSLSYTFQLYFDFSGYCDMAMGVALLFNIRLPINFNSPYKSLDVQDFWKRWHITLGRFLKDYIYIPLGGNKNKKMNTYSNLFITFILGGLWHGASWMFVIWGGLHGLAIVTHRIWKMIGGKLPKTLAWFVTFNFINLTWVFFRADSIDSAVNIIKSMLGFKLISIELIDIPTSNIAWLGQNADLLFNILPNGLVSHITSFTFIVFSLLIISRRNSLDIIDSKPSFKKTVSLALLFVISIYVMTASSSSVFLYFNF